MSKEEMEQLASAPPPDGSFGALLRAFRHRAYLSQEQLAARAELSERTVRSIEAGRVLSPRNDTVMLLADALALTEPERQSWVAAAHGANERQTEAGLPGAAGPAQPPQRVTVAVLTADAQDASGPAITWLICEAGQTVLVVHGAHRDVAGARAATAQAERAGPSLAAGVLNPVPAQRARLALAHGDTATAARRAQQRSLSPDGEPPCTTEQDHLVLARVLLTQDQPDLALRLLGRLLAVAESQGRTGSIIEIRALRALALAAAGDQDPAADELAATLALAAPHGHIRVFADAGPPMAALLGQVATAHRDGQPAARQVPLGYLAAVLRASAPARQAPQTGRGGRTAVPGLIEPLTAREMQVLRLLAAGAPNQRIADDLVVTLDTVKKHVTHVLGKLGAANRTEAVTCARQLGLIP